MKFKTSDYLTNVTENQAEDIALELLQLEFNDAMWDRLMEKKALGYTGWDTQSDFDYVPHMKRALEEGRWADLSNLAMFKWNLED